jgi:hypothetical protein
VVSKSHLWLDSLPVIASPEADSGEAGGLSNLTKNQKGDVREKLTNAFVIYIDRAYKQN